MGLQPRGLDPLKFKLDSIMRDRHKPVGHLRLHTLQALKSFPELYGFRIIKTLGWPQPIRMDQDPIHKMASTLYNILDYVIGRLPSLTANFAVFAVKE